MMHQNQVPEAFENNPMILLGSEFVLVPQGHFLNVDDLPFYVPNDKLSILISNIRSCHKKKTSMFLYLI